MQLVEDWVQVPLERTDIYVTALNFCTSAFRMFDNMHLSRVCAAITMEQDYSLMWIGFFFLLLFSLIVMLLWLVICHTLLLMYIILIILLLLWFQANYCFSSALLFREATHACSLIINIDQVVIVYLHLFICFVCLSFVCPLINLFWIYYLNRCLVLASLSIECSSPMAARNIRFSWSFARSLHGAWRYSLLRGATFLSLLLYILCAN